MHVGLQVWWEAPCWWGAWGPTGPLGPPLNPALIHIHPSVRGMYCIWPILQYWWHHEIGECRRWRAIRHIGAVNSTAGSRLLTAWHAMHARTHVRSVVHACSGPSGGRAGCCCCCSAELMLLLRLLCCLRRVELHQGVGRWASRVDWVQRACTRVVVMVVSGLHVHWRIYTPARCMHNVYILGEINFG